jgi:DNA-binding MarR family transcriptional regulator
MKHYDPETFSSQSSLGYLLKINHALMHDGADRIFAAHDISFVQWIALKKLRDGSALTASDLCREIRHDNGAFTRLLDQLEERGYVSRQRSKQDRRVVDLQITEAGLAKVKELTPLVVNNLNAILAPFSAEEFAQLTGLLNKLKTRLEQYTAEKISDAQS